MTDAEALDDATQAPPHAQHPRKAALLELIVFLLLVVPGLALSIIFGRRGAHLSVLGFKPLVLMVIMQNVSLTALIHYFLWRGGESPALIGWRSRRLWREALLGLALYIPFAMAIGLFILALTRAGLPAPARTLPPYLTAHGGAEYALATLLVIVVAVAEETVYRGYLGLRLGQLTGSRTAMVVLTTIFFAFGHGYQGLTAAIGTGAIGLVFMLIYLWRGSLVAPMVMHFLQDFLVLVLAPLLGLHAKL